MARCFKAAGAKLSVLTASVAATVALGVSSGVAAAQTAAPIVYKTASASPMGPARLEHRADTMSLNVAPHAPIPTFANSAAVDLRPGAQPSSFGPAPLASSPIPEALPLRTAVTLKPGAGQAMTPHAGPPYQVEGRWYVPAHEPNYDEVGIASWYGPTFHGKASASGETFNENDLTAAHPTLPIPSLVKVTNLENNRTVVVRLNDRGPFVDDRIIDLSKAAGAALDMHNKGTAKVRVQYVGPAPADGGGAVSANPARPSLVSATLAPVVPAPVTAPVYAPVQAQPIVSDGQFFVQAGAFGDLANAHAMRSRLAGHGQTSIEAVTVNGAELYRVMVGPWTDRTGADTARLKLASAGTQGMIVSRSR